MRMCSIKKCQSQKTMKWEREKVVTQATQKAYTWYFIDSILKSNKLIDSLYLNSLFFPPLRPFEDLTVCRNLKHFLVSLLALSHLDDHLMIAYCSTIHTPATFVVVHSFKVKVVSSHCFAIARLSIRIFVRSSLWIARASPKKHTQVKVFCTVEVYFSLLVFI